MAYDKADIGLTAFKCTFERSKVVDCSHAYHYGPVRWYTRRQQSLTPVTNLIRIFDLPTWVITIVLLLIVSLFFVTASKIGGIYGLKTSSEELVLIPFR